MGVVERIKQMKEAGLDDAQITKELQEQGVPPKTIKEGFDQLKIKEAIHQGEGQENKEPSNTEFNAPSDSSSRVQSQTFTQTPPTPIVAEQNGEQQEPTPQQAIQPPALNQREYPLEQRPSFQTDPQETLPPPPAPQTPKYEEYYPYPTEEGYPSYPDYEESGGYSVDTIIEISEQVFSEKTKKINKQIDELLEFKTITQTKIENFSERLKYLESIINKLQVSILEKIGSYGQNLGTIRKEMEMMQDSFRKLVEDKVQKKINKKRQATKATKKTTRTTKKKK